MKTTQNTYSGRLAFITPYGIVLFIMMLFGIIGGQKSYGQGVGISETIAITPDGSSILELRSSLRGFLAPRMIYANMLAIPSPAQGLLVYATDKKSFWYYDGGWIAILNIGTGVTSISGTFNRISINGTPTVPIIDIDANYIGQTTINTLGTITTGTWNSTAIGIAYGGTGQTTAQLAINALAGGVTSGQYLRGNGTNVVMSAIQASDVPTLNQNTTGSAAKWTTARNLAGNSVDGSANVPFANKFIVQGTVDAGLSGAQFLGSLNTGLVKNTTTTGVLSIAASGTDYSGGTAALATGILKSTTVTGALTIAVAGDFPILNQNTTGYASTVTTNANLTGMVTSVGNATTVVTNANLTGPITSIGNATSVASQTGIGSMFVMNNSPTLVTPIIGAATGTSLAVTGSLTSSGTAGIGYSSGAGGSVTQLGSKSNPVTINKICGVITTDNSGLNSLNTASFTVFNSTVSATDVPVVAFSGGSPRSYVVTVTAVNNGFFEITILNSSGGSRGEVLVINFIIIKAVIN